MQFYSEFINKLMSALGKYSRLVPDLYVKIKD